MSIDRTLHHLCLYIYDDSCPLRSALLGAAIAFLVSLVFRTGFFNPMLSVQSIPSKARPIEMTPMVIDPSPTEDTGNVEVIKHAEEEEVVDQESSIYETATIYETAVVIGSGLCSYMSAVALGLSGITSIVVAGMIMSCYVAPNLSPTSQERVREVSMGELLSFFNSQLIALLTIFLPSQLTFNSYRRRL